MYKSENKMELYPVFHMIKKVKQFNAIHLIGVLRTIKNHGKQIL
jgi:hypothetical protein